MICLASICMAVALDFLCCSGHNLILVPAAIAAEIAWWIRDTPHVADSKICAAWLCATKAMLTFLKIKFWCRTCVSKGGVGECSSHCCVACACLERSLKNMSMLCLQYCQWECFSHNCTLLAILRFWWVLQVLIRGILSAHASSSIHERAGSRYGCHPSKMWKLLCCCWYLSWVAQQFCFSHNTWNSKLFSNPSYLMQNPDVLHLEKAVAYKFIELTGYYYIFSIQILVHASRVSVVMLAYWWLWLV